MFTHCRSPCSDVPDRETDSGLALHLPVFRRATIEESYSKAMAKLSKLASNGTPMG